MSSTNRGGQRAISDYYITPIYDVALFLREVSKDIPYILKSDPILDPCAGGDEYNPMSYPTALYEAGISGRLVTLDYRANSRADIKDDYLAHTFNEKFELIITNPPFALALPIIQKALTEVVFGGYVVMLLRLNFLGSQARFSFWQDNLPSYIYVHHIRMSFFGGTTDSIEYMHVVWQVGQKVEFSKLRVI